MFLKEISLFFFQYLKPWPISSMKAHKNPISNCAVRTSFKFMAILFTLYLKCGPFYDRHCLSTQYMNSEGVWPLSFNLRLGSVQVSTSFSHLKFAR